MQSSSNRSSKKHRRVIRQGNERFEGDGLDDQELGKHSIEPPEGKLTDDDNRILSELPPHWGLFSAERE